MYFCIPNQYIRKMKRSNRILTALVILSSLLSLVSCNKQDSITVSTQELWYSFEEGTQTITINANCKWNIVLNDQADWFTVSPMSGTKNDSVITVSVKAFEGNSDFRASSFRISSKSGHAFRTVVLSQNILDFDGLVNKIFGVVFDEQWAVDFYGQMIEDTYRSGEFNPYDTTQGYLMYFLENSQGVQRDRRTDHAIYFPFTYEYDVANRNFHIEFETVDDRPEIYNAEVLTASDSLFRVKHEFDTMRWERLDMRKVGVINPEEKSVLQNRLTKRKGNEPIIILD